MKLTFLGVLTALLGSLLVGVPAVPSQAQGRHVESRRVVFTVKNTNTTSVPCKSNNKSYQLRGQLVGRTVDLDGPDDLQRVNVLVHDIGTGGWFWNLRSYPSYDYATNLAKAGETTLVLDRLGYGASPLPNGRTTCLGAHADMLHQVIQDLKSGGYRYADPEMGSTPETSTVVTHGHGVGAAIAEIEAANFDDVAGLILMSWTDSGASPLAVRTGIKQARDCLKDDYAPFAQTASDFRDIMFDSAPMVIQRAATRRRSEDPCGDVKSLASLSSGVDLGADEVTVPVLLMYGARDKLILPKARQQQADRYSTKVTMKVYPGTGSSLPLEKSAGMVRAAVLRWLD